MDPEFVKYATYVTGGLLATISALLAIIGKNFNKHVTAVQEELRGMKVATAAIQKALSENAHMQEQQMQALGVSMDALRLLLAHQDPQLGLNGIQSIPLLRQKVDEVLAEQKEQRRLLQRLLQHSGSLAVLEGVD